MEVILRNQLLNRIVRMIVFQDSMCIIFTYWLEIVLDIMKNANLCDRLSYVASWFLFGCVKTIYLSPLLSCHTRYEIILNCDEELFIHSLEMTNTT